MSKLEDYPNLTLVVIDGDPKIELYSSETDAQVVLRGDNLHNYLQKLGEKIGFSGRMDELYQLANISDELYLQFPDLPEKGELKSISFASMEPVIQAAIDAHDPVVIDDQKVRDELERNWQGDILASVMDEIYRILIKDIVDAAEEMGIEKIRLNENTGNPRFREKVSLALAKIDIQLIIV